MLEDFRGHDPNPSVHERAWMDTNPLDGVLSVATLAGIAIVVGMSVSQSLELERPAVPTAVAEAANP